MAFRALMGLLVCVAVIVLLALAMKSSVINIDPNILGGTPVFRGTRVPIESLFDHLENGVSLDEFLEDFPTVGREQAIEVLTMAEEVLTSDKFEAIYANIA